MTAIRLLFVDDEIAQFHALEELLLQYIGELECFFASTWEEGKKLIEEFIRKREPLDIILFDGQLDCGRTSLDLVSLASEAGLGVRRIAMSNYDNIRKRQLELGCTEACRKSDLLPYLQQLLGITVPA